MGELSPTIIAPPGNASGVRLSPWLGLSAELYAMPGGVVDVQGSANHFLSMHVGAPIWATCRCDGPRERRLQTHGDIDIVPAGLPGVWEDEAPATILLLSLTPALLRSAAEDMGLNPDQAALRPQFQLKDPRIAHIGWALKAELESGYPCEPLYGESLGMALAAHLLRHYAPARVLPKPGHGLSKQQLRRVTEHIENHLDQSLSLAELAAAAGVSASHFKALFKQSLGLPAHQYVIRRRVEHARVLLLQGHLAMSQVALEAGFSHQSHMARCMRRVLGVTPTELLQSRR